MLSLSLAELSTFLDRAPLAKALRLARERRVYNLRRDGAAWQACVLDEAGVPALARLEAGDGVALGCDCGAGQPCLHAWALAARLHLDAALAVPELDAAFAPPAPAPAHGPAGAPAAAPGLFDEPSLFEAAALAQPDLFGELSAPAPARTRPARSRPAETVPHAPAAEAPALAKEPETGLFTGDLFALDSVAALPPGAAAAVVPAAPRAPARAPVRPEAPEAPLPDYHAERPQLVVFLLRLQAMNRPELWVEKLNLNLTPPQAAALRQAATPPEALHPLDRAVRELARRIEATAEHQLSLGSALAGISRVAAELATAPALPLPRLAFTTPNRPLALARIARLDLRSALVRTLPDGSGRYQVLVELSLEGRDAPLRLPAGSIACEGGLVYAVPKGEDVLAWRSDAPALAALVARVRALPAPASALDLELLRTWMAERGLDDVTPPETEGERFERREVKPRAVVSLQAGVKRVEIYLTFAYDGAEVAFHAPEDTLTRALPDGATLVMKRRREFESELHHGLRRLLADAEQYERGLYADLVCGRSVPDITVVDELPNFLAERGQTLIEAGFQLRYEGKPVKAKGSLSFKAESGLDWFGFRAGWKELAEGDAAVALDGRVESLGAPPPGGRRDLVVDERLDSHGLAGAAAASGEGVDAWILLGKRDIERLKLLRSLGMGADGLLETSPVNVSLIDSLYADIENPEDEHVARSRELSRTLAAFTARQQARRPDGSDGPAPATDAAPDIPAGLLEPPVRLAATLRGYQQVGYTWLAYLREQGLGGCLADDMGLGKTVQTIALLQRLKERGELKPSLLIAPVVTLPNWEDEIARFAPDLRAVRHAGANRARTLAELLGGKEPDGAAPGVCAEAHEDDATYGDAASGRQADNQARGRLRAAGKEPDGAAPGVCAEAHEDDATYGDTASGPQAAPGDGGIPLAEPAMGGASPGGAAEAPARPADRDGLAPPDQAPPDLILVSYQTLRNDLDLFVQGDWDYAILDEAHYIKNSGSQIFKAIRVLKARHRLSLTGTPIENSTMELWAQFSFLNPGLLGSQRRFHSEVAAPIEKGGDEQALASLRDTIGPFILRRRKQDVLADLPPKDEILNWCEMGHDQARLYEETAAFCRDQIAGALDAKGVEGSQMDIFRALLRLRQIAIHPGMVRHAPRDGYAEADDDHGGDRPYAHVSSAKLESLRMIVDESLEEDHKMLVFSQFVGALDLISGDLDRTGRRHALLTGQTADRRSVVRDFQNDPDLKIFLLSLKAGGVGINLTAADYVVLFDPWWNPAAERQAVDRAHRMGQQRPVIVYKFITRGTIEEKILALQHKKHRLAGSLLVGDGDDSLLSGMDEDAVMDLFK